MKYVICRYGRRGPLVIAVVIQVVSGVGAAFSPWFWLFLVLRFICASATGGTMVTSFVLVMELVGKTTKNKFERSRESELMKSLH